jgi:hypothetical protein|tara:strand:+ start:131 stop:319 length:189 start_codon:yes stop_codon:yes gene_type:complete
LNEELVTMRHLRRPNLAVMRLRGRFWHGKATPEFMGKPSLALCPGDPNINRKHYAAAADYWR